MSIRKWILRAALVCVTAIVIAAFVGGLWHAWMEWWAGRQLSQQDLWGLRVLYWGRVGLCLQFVAGLAVVLDLIGPERLRQWGESAASGREAAARRIRVAAAQRRLAGRSADLCNCLQADLSDATPGRLPETWLPDPGDGWYENHVRADGYEALLLRAHKAFGGQFVCHDSHSTGWGPHPRVKCADGMRVIDPLVREFLTERVRTEDEAEAVRLLDQPVSAAMFLALMISFFIAPLVLVLVIGVGIGMLVLAWLADHALPVFLGVIVTLALAVLAGSTPLGSDLADVLIERILLLPVLWLSKHEQRCPRAYRFFRDRLRRWTHDLIPASAGPRLVFVGAAIRWQPVRSATRIIAALLDKAEPAHALRWIAIVLFVVGFHFELLAN